MCCCCCFCIVATYVECLNCVCVYVCVGLAVLVFWPFGSCQLCSHGPLDSRFALYGYVVLLSSSSCARVRVFCSLLPRVTLTWNACGSGIETFQVPSARVLIFLIFNGVLSAMSNYLLARVMLITSPLLGNVGTGQSALHQSRQTFSQSGRDFFFHAGGGITLICQRMCVCSSTCIMDLQV
jgi:hypothetical protein